MNTKKQGNIGVAHAIAYYTERGWEVSVPLGDNTRYDLIVDDGVNIHRVQVKTTSYFDAGAQSYVAALRTNGGNRSGFGKVSKIDQTECELVFVYSMIEKLRYEFPVSRLHGKSSVHLKNKDEYIV